MKEILKEWREYLKETKRTEKYFGQPTHPKSTRTKLSPKYDRAVTKAAAQKDFRGTFKVWFGQFLKSNHRKGRMEFLISKMSDEEKQQAARDLNIMRYIIPVEVRMKLQEETTLEQAPCMTINQRL